MGLRGPGAKKKMNTPPEGGPSHGLPWDAKGLSRPERVFRFIEGLRITSGMDAGKPFKLRRWQRRIIRKWYRQDRQGCRIVRTGLLTMGRKNGKTVLIAALCLCHLIGPEAEQRGQVVACAADRDQSGLIFKELVAFIEDNDEFSARCNIKRHEKTIEDSLSGSEFKALSSDAKKSHGLNPSVVIFDELSQWGSGIGRRLYDALVTATGARKEPLTIVISTQSDDDHSLMSELVDYGKQVLDGTIDDPTFVPFIFEVPDDADPFDEKVWILANPALGDFRSLEEMRTFAKRAREIPSQLATFKNLYLNQRISPDERWITAALWEACAGVVDLEVLQGERCFGGLDLGSVRDLTAFALFWPDSGCLSVWSWCPKENLKGRSEEDRVPYTVWSEQNYIEPTSGKATDKRLVALRLGALCAMFKPESIAFDLWSITELQRILTEEGIDLPLTAFGQGFKSMAPAVKSFEERVLNGRLIHSRNPVLTWSVSNVTLETDAAGNGKPSKERSRERIDPLVASIMAVGLSAVAPQEKTYDFSGPLVLSA